MSILKIATIAIIFLGSGILINLWLIRYIINRAIRKYVKPKLQESGHSFINYKWLGFFSHGEFTDDKFVLVPGLKGGHRQRRDRGYINQILWELINPAFAELVPYVRG